MVNQVSVIGFDSSKCKLNMVKKYFVEEISFNNGNDCDEDVFAAKENNCMFLTVSKFKLLVVKNYIRPGLSYDAWCKLTRFKLKKLMFSYE